MQLGHPELKRYQGVLELVVGNGGDRYGRILTDFVGCVAARPEFVRLSIVRCDPGRISGPLSLRERRTSLRNYA